jgi:hypothetical protein
MGQARGRFADTARKIGSLEARLLSFAQFGMNIIEKLVLRPS